MQCRFYSIARSVSPLCAPQTRHASPHKLSCLYHSSACASVVVSATHTPKVTCVPTRNFFFAPRPPSRHLNLFCVSSFVVLSFRFVLPLRFVVSIVSSSVSLPPPLSVSVPLFDRFGARVFSCLCVSVRVCVCARRLPRRCLSPSRSTFFSPVPQAGCHVRVPTLSSCVYIGVGVSPPSIGCCIVPCFLSETKPQHLRFPRHFTFVFRLKWKQSAILVRSLSSPRFCQFPRHMVPCSCAIGLPDRGSSLTVVFPVL